MTEPTEALERLRHGSDIIEDLIRRGEPLMVGAVHSHETGVVAVFDGTP